MFIIYIIQFQVKNTFIVDVVIKICTFSNKTIVLKISFIILRLM